MKIPPILLIIVLFVACSVKLETPESAIEYSDALYDQFDLKKSRQLLESVLLQDHLLDEQRSEVLRKLAHQDWKYHQKYESAKDKLLEADSIGHSKHDTWMLISRIERESQHFREALSAARKAKESAASETEIQKANTEYAQVVYAYSVGQITKGLTLDSRLLDEASHLLAEIVEKDAGMPLPSKLLLGLSIINDDGDYVLKAWQSYFQIQSIQNVHPNLAIAAEKLDQIHHNWHGNALTVADQETLIYALASSRFYEFIPFYIKKSNNTALYNQEIKDIITYSQYLQDIEKATNEYYRLIAIQQEDEAAYIAWLNNRMEALWNSLSITANEPYSERDFLKATEKHFGARGFTGSTGNFSGYVLSLGHIVKQEKAHVEQYGYKPEFTYTEIDMMTSNGYSSWYWEDKAIGGWATDNEIIRVREVYLNGPFAAWKSITDADEKQKAEKVMDEFLNNYSTNHMDLSGGLATTLRHHALMDLYANLSSQGLSGQELKLAFLSEYQQFRIGASLLAHEGRHSIEQKYMPEKFATWSNEVREFHGKLSQIIFASEPRLELAGMVTDFTGDSGHAKANKRIKDIAVACLITNQDNIPTYSNKKSAFAQVHLLTAEQIKACYKSADPLNINH